MRWFEFSGVFCMHVKKEKNILSCVPRTFSCCRGIKRGMEKGIFSIFYYTNVVLKFKILVS